MTVRREIKQGRQVQGADESIPYSLVVTPWGSTPINISAKIYLYDGLSTYTDVTDTSMTGSASANGDVITLPAIHTLTAGEVYRVEVKFTVSSNVFEVYCWLEAER